MIEKLLRSFRSTFSPASQDDFTLDEEVTLYRHRADVALSEERWNDGLVFFAKILRLNPYDLQARMAVAQVYHYGLKEPTKALLTYEKVIAASGYDESNPYCVAAREGIRDLTSILEIPTLPLTDLVDEETSQEDSGGLAQSVAG